MRACAGSDDSRLIAGPNGASVAQLARASDYGSEGSWFKSRRMRHWGFSRSPLERPRLTQSLRSQTQAPSVRATPNTPTRGDGAQRNPLAKASEARWRLARPSPRRLCERSRSSGTSDCSNVLSPSHVNRGIHPYASQSRLIDWAPPSFRQPLRDQPADDEQWSPCWRRSNGSAGRWTHGRITPLPTISV